MTANQAVFRIATMSGASVPGAIAGAAPAGRKAAAGGISNSTGRRNRL